MCFLFIGMFWKLIWLTNLSNTVGTLSKDTLFLQHKSTPHRRCFQSIFPGRCLICRVNPTNMRTVHALLGFVSFWYQSSYQSQHVHTCLLTNVFKGAVLKRHNTRYLPVDRLKFYIITNTGTNGTLLEGNYDADKCFTNCQYSLPVQYRFFRSSALVAGGLKAYDSKNPLLLQCVFYWYLKMHNRCNQDTKQDTEWFIICNMKIQYVMLKHFVKLSKAYFSHIYFLPHLLRIMLHKISYKFYWLQWKLVNPILPSQISPCVANVHLGNKLKITHHEVIKFRQISPCFAVINIVHFI